jgi:Cd2+/Zn2+-exporting ATPase
MRIGFTEYEAKVYLALLRESPATGYQISKKAGVPRSMVYEALGRLHARGAVLDTVEGRATLHRPLPPDLLLERHEAEQRALLDNLRREMGHLYEAPAGDYIWTISGRRPALSYAAQMLRDAAAELFLVLNDEDLSELRDDIEAACQRGVSVSALLTGEGTLACGRMARHPPLESELQQMTGMMMVVVDGSEALIASTEAETTATITRNRNLVIIARQFVWMELFAQRVLTRLGRDLLDRLDPEDRAVFNSLE